MAFDFSKRAGSSGRNVSNSIKNAERRIRAVGGNPNPDSRNWFEKATNLPKDQNWFFDILDLIGRPLNAANTAIDDWFNMRNTTLGDSLYRGFAGRTRTSGSDIVRDFGVDNPTAQFWAGLGWDIFTDPTNLIPGKAVVGAVGAAGKGAKAVGKGAYNLLPDAAKSGIDSVTQGLNRIFGGRYAGMDAQLAKMLEDTNNAMDYYRQRIFDEVTGAMKDLPNAGPEIARLMERDLRIQYDPTEILNNLFKREPFQLRMTGQQLDDFMKELNLRIQQTPQVQDYLNRRLMQQQDIARRISDMLSNNNMRDLYQRRLQGAPLTAAESRVLNRMDRLIRGKTAVARDLRETQRGIRFEPIKTGGKGVQAINPKPQLFREAVGDFEQFVRDMSPTKTFDDMAQSPASRQAAETLLREGKVTLQKGDPVIDDLTRIFGSDVTTKTRKNVTVRLKPDSQYHGERLDDLQFVDRMGPINIERPQRQYSTDPRVAIRANRFMEMNKEILQLAQQNGISINEFNGYMTHILSEAEKAARPRVTTSGTAKYGGNKAVVSGRKIPGSVEDINELFGKEFFNPDAYFATAIGQKRLVEYVLAEGFKRQVLSNPDFARPYTGGPIGKDEVVIRPDDYNFFRNDDGSLGARKGQEYVVHKSVERALNNFKSRIQDESISAFVKGYDAVLNAWKKLTLFSPAYHVRNVLGSNWNMYIAGMSVPDIAKYVAQSISDLRKPYDPLVDAFKRQGLGGSSFAYADFKYGGAESEEALRRALQRQQMTPGQKAVDSVKNILNTSLDIAHQADVMNRYAMFKWAVEKKGMSVEEAARKVKEVLFDYQDLSEVERKVFRRIIPFYTFMKKNAAFQIKYFFENPLRYRVIDKIRDNREGAFDRNRVTPDWLDQAIAIPLTGDSAGNIDFLNLNPPAADLAKWASDPLGQLTSSTSPMVRLPLELATNYDMFMKRPIEEFEGQTRNFLGLDMSAKTAHALDQVGLLRQLDTIFNSDKPLQQAASFGLIRSQDAATARRSKQYERLKELEDMIKLLEQQGIDVPTIRELQRRGR